MPCILIRYIFLNNYAKNQTNRLNSNYTCLYYDIKLPLHIIDFNHWFDFVHFQVHIMNSLENYIWSFTKNLELIKCIISYVKQYLSGIPTSKIKQF